MLTIDDTLTVQARRAVPRSIGETWLKIGDKPMPKNIEVFLLSKMDFIKAVKLLDVASPNSRALFIAEHGFPYDPWNRSVIVTGIVTRRFFDEKLCFMVLLRKMSPKELRIKQITFTDGSTAPWGDFVKDCKVGLYSRVLHKQIYRRYRMTDLEATLKHELEHIYYDELDGVIKERPKQTGEKMVDALTD